MSSITSLEPRIVWEQFDAITQVPRPSKKEGRIIDFLVAFAERHGIEYRKDATGNVVMRKPATPGFENRPAVILQSHMDMVCEKNSDVEFDFEHDAIRTRIDGECGINAKNIARIEAGTAGKSAIRFAVISDTQRWYDETREAVSALNARGDIDFVLHTGDMADFGMKAEFERQRDILNRLHVPYVVLLGNHDCLATGEEIFRTIFGDFNTAFTAGNVRILCLNTNALEFDLREAVPNFEFIETELTEFPPEASKTIVAMHAKPYTEQFGDNVAKGFQYLVTRFPGLQCCINGHGHNYKVVDLFGDGVLYHECDNIAKRSYLLFTVNDEGYACERIEF